MASKKKGKRRRRVTDSGTQLAEVPGAGIEPGQALDEAGSLEEVVAKPRKAVKVPEAEKKVEKVAKKPPRKGPGVFANAKKFFKDVHAEVKKVVWPDSEHLKNSTIVVVGTIVALAAFMGFFSNVFFQISDRVFIPDEPVVAPAGEVPGLEAGPEEGDEDGGGVDAGGGVPVGAEDTS